MKNKFFMTINIFLFLFALILPLNSSSGYDKGVVEKIKISESDLPEGFIFGKIPNFAKSTLLANPWNFDRNAINKLTRNIYPDAESSAVKDIHISIIAKESSPYNDDIVCFIILFKDDTSSKKEILKIEEFSRNNQDRVLTVSKDNLSVILLVDEVNNFPYITKMAKEIEDRLN